MTRTSVTLNAGKSDSEYQIIWIDRHFDLRKGAILEGNIEVKAASSGDSICAAGIVLDEDENVFMAIQLGIGAPDERETHIGRLRMDSNGAIGFESADVTEKGCATVTGVEAGKEHTFRLLLRMGGFELYIDDLLMLTYIYRPSGGKVGLLARNAEVVFSNLKAWSMSLPAETSFEMPVAR